MKLKIFILNIRKKKHLKNRKKKQRKKLFTPHTQKTKKLISHPHPEKIIQETKSRKLQK